MLEKICGMRVKNTYKGPAALLAEVEDEQGNQNKQLLLESSGHNVLDERALSTIKEWRFSHQVEQGQAIAHRVQIPINFQLQ